ncbi:cAMP-responsive element-binding protein-like 2 isoform X2 [Cimex lectularius]|uniref:BZIP domain-containing protein n=1 Tax=Cimex lectularius TaxID=79782 RepID=A0A8I6S6F5_CIMLE|nr:cAMP-responsive element-binding protein-like 2 isoform X2 [Cimex lectularius]
MKERSRQSARECRARKKLRYQYLEELVTDREKAVIALRKELEKYRSWGKDLDEGRLPEGFEEFLEEYGAVKQEL